MERAAVVICPSGERAETVKVEVNGQPRLAILVHYGAHLPLDAEQLRAFRQANAHHVEDAGWDVMAAVRSRCFELHQWSDPMFIVCTDRSLAVLRRDRTVVIEMRGGRRTLADRYLADGYPEECWFLYIIRKPS